MKNNKGLTLVELLAVIALVAMIGVIAFVAMDLINRSNREQAMEAHILTILSSAVSYVSVSDIPLPNRRILLNNFINNEGELLRGFINSPGCNHVLVSNTVETIIVDDANPTQICEVRITLAYLMDAGVLDGDKDGNIINPVTKKPINMEQSYVSIIFVETTGTDVATAETLRARNAIGRYDGRWFYQLREVR